MSDELGPAELPIGTGFRGGLHSALGTRHFDAIRWKVAFPNSYRLNDLMIWTDTLRRAAIKLTFDLGVPDLFGRSQTGL